MDFELTPEQRAIRSTFARFSDERIRMARRSRDVNAEPLNVVHGIRQRIHLHLAGIAGTGVHFANRQ